jgi:hypothetical protein
MLEIIANELLGVPARPLSIKRVLELFSTRLRHDSLYSLRRCDCHNTLDTAREYPGQDRLVCVELSFRPSQGIPYALVGEEASTSLQGVSKENRCTRFVESGDATILPCHMNNVQGSHKGPGSSAHLADCLDIFGGLRESL